MAARTRQWMGNGIVLLVMMLAHGSTGYGAARSEAGDGLPGYIAAEDAPMIRQWLLANAGYRVVATEDCDCQDELKEIWAGSGAVWPPNPGYLPYYSRGDFDGDGHADAAIAVRNGSDTLRFVLFNGAWPREKAERRAFVTAAMPATYAMSYGAPRPTPYRLVIGPFSSHGCVLESESDWQFRLDCETEY